MDTDTLKTLQEVATGGSFAAVARARGVDPSNVSRTVAQAEAQLGFRLFQRSTRAVQPTEAGALYLARIAPLLEELDQARDAAAQVVAQPAGRVRLTASVAFGTEVIVPLLPGLRAALPEVSLEMVLSD
ncbi:MAG: LysR family transcriptional regulator, partial [Pseudomonadota bacterium]